MNGRSRTLALVLAVIGGVFSGWLMAPSPAAAVMGLEETLSDPQDEARAREIARNLRCVVCQNQSIDDSEAPLAGDMRRLVRERIEAGDNNDQVLAYMTDRYGDYVLMRPPFQPNTWVLWISPAAVALMAVGGVAVLVVRRRRLNTDRVDPLSPEEEAAINGLMDDDTPRSPS